MSLFGLFARPVCEPGPEALRLRATLVASTGPSSMVVEPDDGLPRVVAEGGQIRGYRVERIGRGGATLGRAGRCWRLTRRARSLVERGVERPRPKGVEVDVGRGAKVDRATLDRLLEDPSALRRDIRVRFVRRGDDRFLMVTRVRRDGIFGRIGLRRGDRLVGIDGRRVESPNDALAVLSSFLDTGRAEVVVRRGRAVKVFEARVE